MTLAGKVAVITGAGSGVGRAVAVAVAAEGMRPVLFGRRRQPLEETAALARDASGRRVEPVVQSVDVTDEADVSRAFDAAIRLSSGIDVLVCNAGIGRYGPVETYSLADWRATIETNLTGAFLCCRAAIGPLRDRGGGAIVAIASGAGKQGYATLAAYAASKFGLIGFMQSLAPEVESDRIKVSTIVPGSIISDFGTSSSADKAAAAAADPSKRYLEPSDVADALLFLLRQPDRAWTQELNLWPR
jgi:3-oxoacyl-[acyl-carrier protein] reductase